MSVSPSKLPYFAVIQKHKLYCCNYVTGQVKKWQNAASRELTCVKCHPVEELVATGDVTGKIFLYREIFMDALPITTLYHWHHTLVTTIEFTLSGSQMYSGGLENVLVCWNVQSKEKKFLPRMWGAALHIVIGDENNKVAVTTDDNGIQILDPQNNPTAIIQNFTWTPKDKTNIPKFPIGLKVNPRNTSLAMNGHIGHLQFYSTHTQSLLFHVSISLASYHFKLG